jgi:hypothetical protein
MTRYARLTVFQGGKDADSGDFDPNLMPFSDDAAGGLCHKGV